MRNWPRRALVVAGGVMAALGLVAGSANRQLLDGPTFATHVDAVRRDDTVAARLGEQITEVVVTNNPDLAAIQPLIQSVATSAAGSDLLAAPTRRAAQTMHTALVDGDADLLVFQLTDAAAIVAAAVDRLAPVDSPVSADTAVTLAAFGSSDLRGAAAGVASTVGLLAWLLPLIAVACFAVAIVRSRARWATTAACGWALIGGSAGVGLALIAGGLATRAADTSTLRGAVLRAAWRELTTPLWTGVVAMAAIGALTVVACGARSPVAGPTAAARMQAILAGRSLGPRGKVVRDVALALVALAAIVWPDPLVETLVRVGGILLLLVAVGDLRGLATARPPRVAKAPASQPGVRRGVRIALSTAAIVLAVAGVFVLARPGHGVDAVGGAVQGEGLVCNEHTELCDRRFDDVAYVASHNAMSVTGQPGWFIGEQDDPIPAQLSQGVRALLVDVWSGVPAGGVVRTAPGSYDEALAIANEELGPEVVDAALRLADSIAGTASGTEARYLCHGLCEIGSTPFATMLGQLRTWLLTHPDEVVTLFIEDHVAADLIAADIEQAGLVPFTYTAKVGTPFPTLGEMIRAGTRLVVMLEEGSGGDAAPWLANGFELTQDTPYTFPTVESFSCAPNRGPADAPLFLVNHWLSGFGSLVSNAELVNTSDVLGSRVRQCQAERGQIPNFVGVNFVDRGDVWAVVDELNGV